MYSTWVCHGSLRATGMNNPLSGKTIFVTGATGSIGSEIVNALSQKGNKVIAAGRNPVALAHLESIPRVTTMKLDLEERDSIEDVVRHLENLHPELEILIQCAGIQLETDLESHPDSVKDFRKELEVNLIGTIHLTLRLLPLLLANKGTVVHTGTLLQYAPKKKRGAYSAGKAGLHIYTQYLHRTMRRKIRVFEFVPPPLATGLSDQKVDIERVAHCVRVFLRDFENGKNGSRPGIGRIVPLLFRLFPNYIYRKTWES